jgi:hypothetical protein
MGYMGAGTLVGGQEIAAQQRMCAEHAEELCRDDRCFEHAALRCR